MAYRRFRLQCSSWIDKNSFVVFLSIVFLLLLHELVVKTNVVLNVRFPFDRIFKFLAELNLLILIILKVKLEKLYGFFILVFIFLISSIYFLEFFGTEAFYSRVILFNKFIFPFLVVFSVGSLMENNRDTILLFVRVFQWVLLGNAIFIFIGFLFDIYMLKSYSGDRFGYSGLFYMSNDVSLLYILGATVSVCRWNMERVNKDGWFALVFVISGLLIGTKSFILFVVLAIPYGLFFLFRNKHLRSYSILLFVALFFLVLALVTFSVSDYFYPLFQEHGIIYSFSSMRSHLFVSNYASFRPSLFPLLFGVGNTSGFVEMDFFDAFYFFGLIGGVFYFRLVFSHIFLFRKGFNAYNYFSILVLIISFLAGHLFWSGLNGFYLGLFGLWSKTLMPQQASAIRDCL